MNDRAMTVEIEVSSCTEHYEDCYVARCAFPEICACSWNRQEAVEFVKGAVLHAIGEWPKVPMAISFRVKEG